MTQVTQPATENSLFNDIVVGTINLATIVMAGFLAMSVFAVV